MKKLFLPLMIFAFLAACSKNEDAVPNSFIHAKVDGTSRDFNVSIVAQRSNEGKTVTIVAAGGNMSSAFPAMSLDIEDDGILAPKVYKASDAEVVFGYLTNATNSFLSQDDFTVTITAINDADSTGTFSGTITNGSSSLSVEDGTFYARFE
jgi:hypothetical protein